MRLGALWPYLNKMGLQVRVSKETSTITVTHTFPEFPFPEKFEQQTSLRDKVKNIYAEMGAIGTPQIMVADPFAPNMGTTVAMYFARNEQEYLIDSIADTLATDYAFPHIIPLQHPERKVGGRVPQMP